MTGREPQPATEARHPGTRDLDELSTLEFVRVMNGEDARIAGAIAAESVAIARAIDAIAGRMRSGGRIVYVGAGTSGRLGVLDAAECPATFGTSPKQVIAIIAGGQPALTGAAEDAEDDEAAGAAGLARVEASPRDSVVGVSASGQTPFVIGALGEARRRGAYVISIAGTRPSVIEAMADVGIAPVVGPEILTGSTRLKAGTAQKMVLNMLSTGVMVRLGKTFGNLMVDVRPTNAKLRERARRIVQEAVGLGADEAEELLRNADGSVKVAIVAGIARIAPAEAKRHLDAASGAIRDALRSAAAMRDDPRR
jgi:N-acetylmuramic acid 6-phosphate etherase